MKTKKAQSVSDLAMLFQSVLMLIMVAVIVGLGTMVLGSLYKYEGNMSALGFSNYTMNVLGNGSAAIGSISTTWISIIVIVIVVGLLISILLGAFALRQRQ